MRGSNIVFGLLFSVVTATSAWAAPLSAEVLLAVPNHSGQVPSELRPLASSLKGKGYTGATVAQRQRVTLTEGRETLVHIGRVDLELQVLSIQGDRARVRVTRGSRKPTVVTVPVDAARFFVVAPKKGT